MDAATLTAWALILTAAGTFITAVVGALTLMVSRRNVAVSERNSAHLQKIEVSTNGLSKELGRAKLAQGTAEGTAVGLQQGRDEANK